MALMMGAEITKFLSQRFRVPAIDVAEYEIPGDVVRSVTRELCEKHAVIPVARAGDSLIVAMVDPTNDQAIGDLKNATSSAIEPVIASEAAIRDAIEKHYRPSRRLN